MTSFELLPEGGTPTQQDADYFWWPTGPGSTTTVTADIGAWLGSLGTVPSVLIDLVRIAAGAYMADRRSRRGQGFTRTIDLHVQVVASESFRESINDIADLLAWLTGDEWSVSLSDDGLPVPETIETEDRAEIDSVALLSGGLDSFCGAALAGPDRRLFVGHWDSPTIKGAQNRVKSWLDGALGDTVQYNPLRLMQAARKLEPSNRSRSLLFMALGSAIAEARVRRWSRSRRTDLQASIHHSARSEVVRFPLVRRTR